MTLADKCLSIVVLTEDSADDARATIETLSRRMFEVVVPGFGSHRIDFIPRDAHEEEAMRGANWKADKCKNPMDREKRVRLLRYIARRLSQPDTFVLFHIDGDRRWSERGTSENTAKFQELVDVVLPQTAARGRANAPKASERPEPPPMRLEHLILVCPFRSVEAWAYQNIEAAIEICRREHRGAHVAALRAWSAKRGDLDELPAPEKALCLGKDHNFELVKSGYPAQVAYEVGKSFAATVERVLGCDALCQGLERTRGWG